MTLYTFILFVHVLGSLGLFIGFALEFLCLKELRSASNQIEALEALRRFRVVRLVYIPSFLAIVASGLYLASIIGSEGTL